MEHRRKSFEERQRKSLETIALRYGFRGGLVLIFIFLLMYFLQTLYGDYIWARYYIRLTDLGWIKYFNLPVIFYVIYKGTRIYKIRHNYAYISYSKSVLSGTYISIYSILMVALFSVIFYKFIDPASLSLIMEKHYLNPETTRAARAFNFLRPYTMTFIASFIYILLISFTLIKKERAL